MQQFTIKYIGFLQEYVKSVFLKVWQGKICIS